MIFTYNRFFKISSSMFPVNPAPPNQALIRGVGKNPKQPNSVEVSALQALATSEVGEKSTPLKKQRFDSAKKPSG